MFNIFFQTTTSLVKIPHRFTATQRVTSLQTPKNRPERLYTHFLRSGRYLPAHSDYSPTASLSRRGDALLIATQHPFYRDAARHVATNTVPPGKREALQPLPHPLHHPLHVGGIGQGGIQHMPVGRE